MSNERERLSESQVWVVKIGSALLTSDGVGIDADGIDGWCEQISLLLDGGKQIALVTSGAVAEGFRRLGFTERPDSIHELQAAAAVGQMGIVQAYEESFRRHNRRTALVLLTHDDLSDRQRYLNARGTLRTLLEFGIVPVINENDSVATEEIQLGDNDTLAARVASLVSADALVLLTDQNGLYEDDPRIRPNAPMVNECSAFDSQLDDMVGSGSGALGRGGMVTKLEASRYAARAGCHTVIANGREQDVLSAIATGQNVGTLLTADVAPLDARKQWIAAQVQIAGGITLDAGAVQAVQERGVSVLAVGVSDVQGNFGRGDVVSIIGPDGVEVGKGLVNYGAVETDLIKGHGSDVIEELLGYVDEEELIHRDNLALS
ncbi:MAG: glutamate 5-kinase [Pseudomonadota bacterium]|nr:glutamate 5-kinase [Pseudomonadota bacterium]